MTTSGTQPVAPAAPPPAVRQPGPGSGPGAWGPPQQLTTPPAQPGRVRSAARRLLYGTPGRMRVVAVVTALAALLAGAACVNAILSSRAAVERAANSTAQVVRVQAIQVDLLRADALATNAFLVGGLEPPEQRAAYEAALSSATAGIAEAAAAQPADGRALGALADEVRAYTALVEQARANNRIGLPLGAQYLREASQGLRADALPVVETIAEANRGRAAAEFERVDATVQLLLGLLALGVIVAAAVWLARRTHRYLNGPLTLAGAVLVAILMVSAWVISGTSGVTHGVESGSYARAVSLSAARTAANDARANESLGLIARGSGATFEEAWQERAAEVERALAEDAPGVRAAWDAYTQTHRQVRESDGGGDWEGAVELATSTGPDGLGARFATVDDALATRGEQESATAVDELGSAGTWLPAWAALAALGALVAAWLSLRGIGQRIEEYR